MSQTEQKKSGEEEEAGGVSQAPTQRAPPPSWLDAAFVREALRRGGDANALFDDVQVEYAIAPGVNYCSAIFRVRLCEGEGEGDGGRTVLVKVLPPGGQWAALVEEARLFERELLAFAGPLPAMQALLDAAAPKRFAPFAARCYDQGRSPTPYVVMEDLAPQGFRLADRLKGLDLPHALVAIKALGCFHGTSAVLWKRRPELFQGLDSFFEDSGADMCADFYDKGLQTVADTIQGWSDFQGNFPEKIRGIRKNIFQKWAEVNRIRPGKLNVLIHGDFMVNNLLFRYEGKEVRDVRFLDFQLSHVGNPAIDLIIHRYVCLTEEVFDNHWDTLLEAYRDSFAEAMQVLGEDNPPSLEDIQRDLEEARAYIFLAAFVWLPSNKQEGGVDLDEVLANDKKVVHKSSALRRWLEKLLPMIDAKGMFEELM